MASRLSALRTGVGGELRKLPAFLRRDLRVQLSYRTAFLGDIVNLAFQATMFFFVQKMVDPTTMPSYEGTRASYMAFVVIGISLGAFLQVGVGRVVATFRNEQLLGTLESLFMSPTRPLTIQVGLVVYDLLYVPIRTALFLAITAWAFGVEFRLESALPVLAIVILFLPLVWGMGMGGAAAILTFRRGGGFVGLFAAALTVGAGAYFPLHLLPSWVQSAADQNPVALVFEGARSGLIGGAGWSHLAPDLFLLSAWSAGIFGIGLWAFGRALRRERRHGTMSLY
jgi:ABC-2 type transport system permease protein